MGSAPKVAILLLNWNQKDTTLQCLQSLSAITYPNHDIILVDNASEDDSVAAIRTDHPEVTLLENEINLKVTGGRNFGIHFLLPKKFDYLLFLDNDTVIDPGFLEPMVRTFEEDERIAAVTGKILFFEPDDIIWCAGGNIDYYRFNILLEGHGERDDGGWDTPRDVDHITGCCFMVSKRALLDLGPFDPAYVYGEDTEWCLRAKMRGYRIVYQPEARIWHKVSASWSEGNVGRVWGRIIFQLMRQYAGIHHWFVFSLYSTVKLIKALATQPTGHVLSKVRGSLEGLFTRGRR